MKYYERITIECNDAEKMISLTFYRVIELLIASAKLFIVSL